MANKKNHLKSVKFEIEKISNGVVLTHENAQTHHDSESIVANSAKGFVESALQSIKENETYAVTITVTKIK
jgi:hypothetical protein